MHIDIDITIDEEMAPVARAEGRVEGSIGANGRDRESQSQEEFEAVVSGAVYSQMLSTGSSSFNRSASKARAGRALWK